MISSTSHYLSHDLRRIHDTVRLVLSGVSKTAILTLRARADEHHRSDRFFADPHAVQWLEKIGWPSELDRWYDDATQSFLVFRADEIDRYTKEQLAKENPVVVELGCGLSSRSLRLGRGRWIDLDLPEVISAREGLGISGEQIACSVLDRSWFDAIEIADPTHLFLIAEGLFYYLDRNDVNELISDLKQTFPGATIAFDVLGEQDFQATQKNSAAVGTPVQWQIAPPFDQAHASFGLRKISGADPKELVEELLDRYWPRFGKTTHWLAKRLSQDPVFRGKRSGVIYGKL